MALTDVAIETIKDMILSGQLRPGARLPSETDLAAEIGVSRNSLREAVRALAVMHILDVRHGDGTYVASLRAETLVDALSFLLEFRQDDSVLHILAVRRILEPAATALAARAMSDRAIAELRGLVGTPADPADITSLVSADLRFHAAIAHGSGNPVLASLLDSLAPATVSARVWRGLTEDGAVDRTHHEHAAIVDALADRDHDLAAARALSHIAGVERWLRFAGQATASDPAETKG